jgi:hypothetical protein
VDFLTHKKFKTVAWFREVFPETPLYQFTTGEIDKIARANWQHLEIEELKTEQYQLIRNAKNPYRIGFGFSTIMDIYTQEEQISCKRYLEEISGSHDEEVWKEAREKMFECYRNLPPLP